MIKKVYILYLNFILAVYAQANTDEFEQAIHIRNLASSPVKIKYEGYKQALYESIGNHKRETSQTHWRSLSNDKHTIIPVFIYRNGWWDQGMEVHFEYEHNPQKKAMVSFYNPERINGKNLFQRVKVEGVMQEYITLSKTVEFDFNHKKDKVIDIFLSDWR